MIIPYGRQNVNKNGIDAAQFDLTYYQILIIK